MYTMCMNVRRLRTLTVTSGSQTSRIPVCFVGLRTALPARKAPFAQVSFCLFLNIEALALHCSWFTGGPRAWPLPGYWSAGETSIHVYPCAIPSTFRCPGWDPSKGQAQCGEGYRQGSPKCAVCDDGFYPEDGICRLCPANSGQNYSVRLLPLFIAAGIGLAMFILLVFLLRWLFRAHGVAATGARLLKLPFDYVLWLFVAFQLLAQAGRSSAPGAPSELRRVFDVIQLVQLDFGGVAPPQCTEGSPFPRFIAVFAIALGIFTLWLLLAAKSLCSAPQREKGSKGTLVLSFTRYLLLSLLLLGYPLTMNMASIVMECSGITDEGGKQSYTWDFNPFYRCLEGEHIVAFALSVASAALIGILLPLLLLLSGRKLSLTLAAATAKPGREAVAPAGKKQCCPPWCRLNPRVHAALRKDRAWVPVFGFGQPWFRTAYLYLFLWLAFLQWLPDTTLVQQLVNGGAQILSLLGFAVAVALLRPDHEWGTWRRWPRFATSVASACVVGMRMSFLWDAAQRDAAAQDSAAASSNVEPISAAVASPQPSLLSTVLVWAVLCLIVALPLVQLTSFLIWLNGLVPLRQACCACCRTRNGSKHAEDHKASSTAAHALLTRYLADDSRELRAPTPRKSAAAATSTVDAKDTEKEDSSEGIELQRAVAVYNPMFRLRKKKSISVGDVAHTAVASDTRDDADRSPDNESVVMHFNPLSTLSLNTMSDTTGVSGIVGHTEEGSLPFPTVESATSGQGKGKGKGKSKGRSKGGRAKSPRSNSTARMFVRTFDREAYAKGLMTRTAEKSRYARKYVEAAGDTVAGRVQK